MGWGECNEGVRARPAGNAMKASELVQRVMQSNFHCEQYNGD